MKIIKQIATSCLRYIGMDVHSATISIAVRDATGKVIMEATIATQAAAIVDFVRGLQGSLHVAFEEGVQAAWLYELLLPHVAEVVVCDPRRLPRHKGERKNDKIDARQLSEWLRVGSLAQVYHHPTNLRTLRELTRSYVTLVSDTTRVMNRLKAIYRGRGIPSKGTRVYSPRFRQAWLDQLPEGGLRRRAELLYQQWDLLLPLRHSARKQMIAESRKHAAQKIIATVPTFGAVRAALLMAAVQTPHRFRTNRKFWTYAGLGVVSRSSADYRLVAGELTRSRKPVLVLGLNWNHNHLLKAVFKEAAATAVARPGPFQEFYAQRVAQGMEPQLARLVVARKLATVVLTLWKKGERFNAKHLKPQAA
jgi:transposase